MAIKFRVDEEPGCFWVNIRGTDSELNDVKNWVRERWDLSRAQPYKNNHALTYHEAFRHHRPEQILHTTIPMFHKSDVMLLLLTWKGVI